MLRLVLSRVPVPVRNQVVWNSGRSFWSRRPFDPAVEVSNAIRNVERVARDFDRDVSRLFDEMGRGFFKRPSFYSPFCVERPVVVTPEGSRIFRKKFDMKDLRPEDIKVTLKDRHLTIQGKRSDKSDHEVYSVEYNYEFTLPEEVNPDEVKSVISEDGFLLIEAPLPEVEKPKPKEIPVERTKD